MPLQFSIRPLEPSDISQATHWARSEGFCPGEGDVAIYRQTDRQGLWVGCLGEKPIGCIAGVRYSQAYGFIGMFLVTPRHRGLGYGVQLWRHPLDHLNEVACVGVHAAPDRIADYAGWGFQSASPTTRWQLNGRERQGASPQGSQLSLVDGTSLPEEVIQAYDASREPSPRPHFLRDWLHHPAGTVLALVDGEGQCHGFGRIRPCLLKEGTGWRIGPLLADDADLAEQLLRGLLERHRGVVLLDAPGANPAAAALMGRLGFAPTSETLRMYRGAQPQVSLADVYGLACLELG
jgi:[ribosomal protein S18]-alanine N-acetyltransferase